MTGTIRAIRWMGYYLCTGLLISVIAFINGYPLVYSDTGTYIFNAFKLEQLEDRPIGYGLIIRAVTWQSTLWTVVIFQGMITSWLLMLIVREMFPRERRVLTPHLTLVLFLVAASSLPWYAAQIMADIYTPLVLLVAYLILRGTRPGKAERIALHVLLFFFIATHNSHFPMMGIGLVMLGIWRVLRGNKAGMPWSRWSGVAAMTVGAAMMIALFNLTQHRRLKLSLSSNVFMAARLSEGGLLHGYLEKHCAEMDHPICDMRDDLPRDFTQFLWSERGYVQRSGMSFMQADSTLAPVVAGVLGDPECRQKYLRSVATSSARQFVQWEAGAGLHAYGEGTSPYAHLWWRLPREKKQYEEALQQQGELGHLPNVNRIIGVALIASLLVIAVLMAFRKLEQHRRLVEAGLWILTWLMLNAIVASAFTAVDPRLQSRVVWLVPMLAVLMLRAAILSRREDPSRPDAELR